MSGRDIRAGGAYVEIGIKNRLAKGARQVQADLNKLSKSLSRKGSALGRAGLAVGATTAGLLAAPVAAASEMQETLGKFETVFGKQAAAQMAWAKTSAETLGTSRQEMLAMLSGMQDLLVPMGVLPDQAGKMSQELSTLAVDLGSFNNRNTADVFGDLQAALTGSGEVMKKYGVVLSEAAVKQELLARGLNPKEATEAAKAQARLAIIMRGTTAAQGDAVRTAGSFANQTKRLHAAVADAAAEIGGPLLDDLASLVSVATNGIGSFAKFAEGNKELFRIIGLSLVAITGLAGGAVAIGGTMIAASVAVSGLATAVGLLLSPVGLAIGGVAALGVGLVRYTEIGGKAIDWLRDRFGPLVETVSGAAGAIMAALQMGDTATAWALAMDTLELLWLDLTDEIRDVWASAMSAVLDKGADMAAGMGRLFQSLSGLLKGLLSQYEGVYNKIYNFVLDAGGSVSGVQTIGGPVNAFENNFGGAKQTALAQIENVRKFGVNMEQAAEGQRKQRREQSETARAERQQRLDALRQSVTTQTVTVKKAAETAKLDAAADLAKAQAEIDAKANKFGDQQNAIDQEAKRTGPSGTFSAFAAGIIGTGETAEMQIQRDQLDALKQIAANTVAPAGRFA